MRSYLSLECKDTGHIGCTHIAYGASEEALFRNAEYHAIKAHGYTEESWKEELSKNLEQFRKLVKMT
ncbi:MAG TPA: DUF1059 domain-containing protein [Nitrososphaeraceae archaeon]